MTETNDALTSAEAALKQAESAVAAAVAVAEAAAPASAPKKETLLRRCNLSNLKHANLSAALALVASTIDSSTGTGSQGVAIDVARQKFGELVAALNAITA